MKRADCYCICALGVKGEEKTTKQNPKKLRKTAMAS